MRFLNKYKNFNKNFFEIQTFPKQRLLKFKRPKWLRVQKLLQRKKTVLPKKFKFKFQFRSKRKYKSKVQLVFSRLTYLRKNKNRYRKSNKIRKLKLKKIRGGVMTNQKVYLQKRFYNHFLIKAPIKRWSKMRFYYRESLFLQQGLLKLFDNFVTVHDLKCALRLNPHVSNRTINTLIIKFFFRLEILLWKLTFFSSVYEARQAVKAKKVLVNGSFVQNTKQLQKGDIVLLSKILPISFQTVPSFFYSFLEIDYYAGVVVILKNWDDLTHQEIFYLFNGYIHFKKFLDYIRLK